AKRFGGDQLLRSLLSIRGGCLARIVSLCRRSPWLQKVPQLPRCIGDPLAGHLLIGSQLRQRLSQIAVAANLLLASGQVGHRLLQLLPELLRRLRNRTWQNVLLSNSCGGLLALR